MLADLGVKAGSNDEGCTSSHSTVSLLAGQNGASAQQHLGHLLVDDADALLSTCSAEGDLRSRQAAVRQSLAQGQSFVYAVKSNNRDNADLIDLFYDGIHNAFLLYDQTRWFRGGRTALGIAPPRHACNISIIHGGGLW